MLNSQLIVLAGGKIYGPFKEQKTLTKWRETQSVDIRENCEVYTLKELPVSAYGTAEHAEECGVRIDIRQAA